MSTKSHLNRGNAQTQDPETQNWVLNCLLPWVYCCPTTFRHPFPDLFEWIVPHMDDLPRPQRTLKTPKSQKPTLQAVPL